MLYCKTYKPSDAFSDNGQNFVGANKELRTILRSLFKDKSEEEIENYLSKKLPKEITSYFSFYLNCSFGD